MKSHARVVVIGGGVVGCSLLYHLMRLGWKDVVLIERNELTSGSTWHAAGQISMYAETPYLARLAKESTEGFLEIETVSGESCGIHLPGGLRLTRSADGIEEFKRYLTFANAIGIDAEIVGVKRAKELFPLLESNEFTGALHTPNEGFVDPTMTTNAFAKMARAGGAQIYRHTNVTGLKQRPSGAWLVETNQGDIVAEIVVNCGGSWGGRISELLGCYLPVFTIEHQYFITEQFLEEGELSAELPVMRDPSVPNYIRQERRGLMVSAFEHEAPFAWLDGAPNDFSMELYPPDLERSEECLEETLRMVPRLASLGIRTVVNGPLPSTPDMQGLLGPAHGLRNYYVCCAIHGAFLHGSLTRYMAEWIVEGEPSIDLSVSDVRRFGDYVTHDYSVSRIEQGHTMFSLPAAYPGLEPPGGREARTDPLYEVLKGKGAVFGVANGWEVPNWFAPEGVEPVDELTFERANYFEYVGAECRAVRENAGLLDTSSLAKFAVEGPDTVAIVDRLTSVRLPEINGFSLAPLLTESGGIYIMCILHRTSEDRFYITAPPEAEQRLRDLLREATDSGDAEVTDFNGKYAAMVLAGPKSFGLLETLTDQSLADIGIGQFRDIKVSGSTVRLARLDDIDPCAWDVQSGAGSIQSLYESLFEIGADQGLVDFGMRAWNSLRLERGLPRAGFDYTTEMTPEAAGLGELVDMGKGDFVGRAALLENPPKRGRYKLTMIHLDEETVRIDPWGAEVVERDGKVIGMVSTGSRGHTVNRTIAFAHLEPGNQEPGTKVEVVILGERYGAVVGKALC